MQKAEQRPESTEQSRAEQRVEHSLARKKLALMSQEASSCQANTLQQAIDNDRVS